MAPVAGQHRRHPLCPHCRYDLVGTIAANKRVCPECGEPFTLNQLLKGETPGEWSAGAGLRRAAVALLIRALLCLPFWTGFVWLATPLLGQLPMGVTTMGAVGLVFVIPGVAIGHVLSRGLNDIAGMQSIVVTAMAFAFIVAVAAGGVEIAAAFQTPSAWTGFISTATSAFAGLWTVRNLHFAE